jgi:hypothetical protein
VNRKRTRVLEVFHSHRLHKTKVQLARKMSGLLQAECEIYSSAVK